MALFAGQMRQLKKSEIIKAIRRASGNLTVAARALGCSRSTIYNRMGKDEEIKEVYEEQRETTLDAVEDSLVRLALDGNVTACIFLLKTRGRDRGYTESQELIHYTPDKPPTWFDGSPIET